MIDEVKLRKINDEKINALASQGKCKGIIPFETCLAQICL
jgi:hypothetical protein